MYPSPYAVVACGRGSIISSSGGNLAMPGVRPWTEDPMSNRHLAIVRRGQYATYDLLTRAFAADPHVRVIWDRRLGARRRTETDVETERRFADRRSTSQSSWNGSDYLLLSVSGAAAESASAPHAEPLALTAAIAEDVECAIRFDVPVLLTGGEPRERQSIAEFVHHRSTRGGGPFRIVDGAECRLMQSLDAARFGTVFVPEIGVVSSDEQADLLKFLAEQTANDDDGAAPRLVTASDRDLLADIEAGTFSSQLFYHLNLIHVRLGAVRR